MPNEYQRDAIAQQQSRRIPARPTTQRLREGMMDDRASQGIPDPLQDAFAQWLTQTGRQTTNPGDAEVLYDQFIRSVLQR